jgi:hypothetical protein
MYPLQRMSFSSTTRNGTHHAYPRQRRTGSPSNRFKSFMRICVYIVRSAVRLMTECQSTRNQRPQPNHKRPMTPRPFTPVPAASSTSTGQAPPATGTPAHPPGNSEIPVAADPALAPPATTAVVRDHRIAREISLFAFRTRRWPGRADGSAMRYLIPVMVHQL